MKAKGEAVSEILGFLAGIPLFSRLSESSSLLLARASKFKHFENGDILFFSLSLLNQRILSGPGTALIRSKHPELTPFQAKTVLTVCASNRRRQEK